MTTEIPLEVDVSTVKSMRDEGTEFLLLDCREPDERLRARIAGTLAIPMNEIPDRLAELEPYRHGRVVVHCHHGGRSLRVTHWLRQQGFAQAQNMEGGIDAWSTQVDPQVPRY